MARWPGLSQFELTDRVALVTGGSKGLGEVIAALRRVVAHGGRRGEAISLALELDQVDAAVEFAGRDAGALADLADRIERDGIDLPDVVNELRAAAEVDLRRRAATNDPRSLAKLASLEADAGNEVEAIALLQRALARQPSERRWRLELVRLLRATGQPVEALDEVRDLLRRDPDDGSAIALARELSIEVVAASTRASSRPSVEP